MVSVQLKKFDMTSIADDKVVVFVGKRETGKSFLVRDMLYYKQDIPVGTVISGTEAANSFYSSMMPSLFIHGEFTEEIVTNYLKRQRKIVQEYNSNDHVDPRAFFILDDCLYDNTWIKNKNIRSMFMNGRHYKSLFVITMQYALGIPPNLRTNIDYIFILRENILANRKRIFEQYAGMFPSFDIFNQVMDQCTENYECLVINNNSKSNKLEEQVFWYKANPHDDFKIGHPSIWKFHQQNYNPTDEDDELDKYKQKKTNIKIKVHKSY